MYPNLASLVSSMGSSTQLRLPRKLLLKLVLREERLMLCGLRTDRCIDNLCHGAVAEFAKLPFHGEDDNNPSESFGFRLRGIVSIFRHPQMKLGQTWPNHLFRPCTFAASSVLVSVQVASPTSHHKTHQDYLGLPKVPHCHPDTEISWNVFISKFSDGAFLGVARLLHDCLSHRSMLGWEFWSYRLLNKHIQALRSLRKVSQREDQAPCDLAWGKHKAAKVEDVKFSIVCHSSQVTPCTALCCEDCEVTWKARPSFGILADLGGRCFSCWW